MYEGDQNWVAPLGSEVRRTLDPDRNPYFANATLQPFLCYRDGAIVARLVVVINRLHEKTFGTRTAFFGFFECVNDAGAARALFERAESYCRALDVHHLEGPFNPNHYSELGLLIDAFDKPVSFFQTYNPPYYARLLEDLGYHQSTTLLTSRTENVKAYAESYCGQALTGEAPEGYAVRHFNMQRRDEELEHLRDIFNDAFSENWHYLPLSADEYRFSAKFLHLVTEPELITIVEHEGQPVGVLMCVLDINPLLHAMHGKPGPVTYLRFLQNRKRVKNLIVYAVGIRKSHRHTTVGRLLFTAMVQTALDYETLETTWMSPSNRLALRTAERLGMTPYKHFAIYDKSLITLRQNHDRTNP